MNLHTPPRYDERRLHLAIGIEPRAAGTRQRLTREVDVRLESYPRPIEEWRRWPPGASLTEALPRLTRHRSGRFARTYDEGVPLPTTLRLVSDGVHGQARVPGGGRTVVPRRVRISPASATVVEDADADPATPAHPAWRRTFPLACFPGAASPLPTGATVVRGSVVRDVGGPSPAAVRWARVHATIDGTVIDAGWAHGDDRGEFVLIVEPDVGGLVIPDAPLSLRFRVGATVPPIAPDPAEPLLAVVDDLWDLPVEDVTASATPETEPTITGRGFLPGHTIVDPVDPVGAVAVPLGRQTTIQIRIP